MGKRYYCDYCDKTMAATPSTVRTHMKGLVHQKLMLDHYQQFKEPETIFAEESIKKPCSRFPRGECQFGSMCRFSHYTREQIDNLREIVATRKRLRTDITQPSFEDLYQKLQDQKSEPKSNDGNTVLYDKNGITHVFPWVYNAAFGENIPPSIKELSIELYIPNDDSVSLEDNKAKDETNNSKHVDKKGDIKDGYDRNIQKLTNTENIDQIYLIKSTNDDDIKNKVYELNHNLLDLIKSYAESNKAIETGDNKILRSMQPEWPDAPSVLEYQLAHSKDIMEYIKTKNNWLHINHISPENVIRQEQHKPFKLNCNKPLRNHLDKTRKQNSKTKLRTGLKRTKNKQVKGRKKVLRNDKKLQGNSQLRHWKPVGRIGNQMHHFAHKPVKKPDRFVWAAALKRRQERYEKKIDAQRQRRVDKIMEFLKPNVYTTRYIYHELKRIAKTNEIRDKLRKMVWIMEQPFYQKQHLAEKVLMCYRKFIGMTYEEVDLWGHDKNNMVIHVLQNPPNDGVP